MNISGFYSDSISNGEGWRAVLFVSGCPHRCHGCHNEKTWDRNYGTPYDEEEIYQKIIENEMLDGLTLSGGEPFLYYRELLPLAKRVRERGLTVWAYTGYVYEDLVKRAENDPVLNEFIALIDVMVDGRFMIEEKDPTLLFRGSRNQRMIDVKKSLKVGKVIIYEC